MSDCQHWWIYCGMTKGTEKIDPLAVYQCTKCGKVRTETKIVKGEK